MQFWVSYFPSRHFKINARVRVSNPQKGKENFSLCLFTSHLLRDQAALEREGGRNAILTMQPQRWAGGRGQPCPISRSPPRPLCICLPVPSPPTSSNRCGAAILRRHGCYGAPLGHRDVRSTIPRVKAYLAPPTPTSARALWSPTVFPSHTLALPLARDPTLIQGCLFFLPLSGQEGGSILLP